VSLFVAASTADLVAAWQADCAGSVKFEFHAGASVVLARQIEAGAETALFLPAGWSAMSLLAESGRFVEIDSAFLENEIVLVCSRHVAAPECLDDLLQARFERIAIADPRLAPAGVYTREGLERAAIWTRLENKLIPAADVRVALEAVRQGAADAGFVYATDTRMAPELGVLRFGSDSPFPSARYPLAILEPAGDRARVLWDYLHSERARNIAREFGFQ
jgi:molybdate transport system substrate-binding protein